MRTDDEQVFPFARQWVWMTKQECIDLKWRASYWQSQYQLLKAKYDALEQELQLEIAKSKDLRHRLFGKKSEKSSSIGSEKDDTPSAKRPRGQIPGKHGHGRTQRPDLPIIIDETGFPEGDPCCPHCGLPDLPKAALDQYSDLIEVKVGAHIRRYRRPAYVPNPGCQCQDRPAIITAPLPPKLIPRNPYDTSVWVEIILSKFRYGQPAHRYLQDLTDQGLPISPGTIAGGLKRIAPLFEPVMEALYCKQMTEKLFHNDETRWEVFVKLEGKEGHRWYLWVTRSRSVVYYILDPGRSAAVPGAHFAGLCQERVIIVCDRYSAYKKLARLSEVILLAFCWAHVRRDYLDTGRTFTELKSWALEWKETIGLLYHHNKQRLAHWDEQRPLDKQSAAFQHHHQILAGTLQSMHQQATRLVQDEAAANKKGTQGDEDRPLSKSARNKQRKVCQSLLDHWQGLSLFLNNPQVPLDNNIAENSIRGPVNGRKNYYGSGSLWSATLAATLFSILQTLALWGINTRHWLTAYLNTCAKHGGKAPQRIETFLPWCMDAARRAELSGPLPPGPSAAIPLHATSPPAPSPAEEPPRPQHDSS